MTSDCMDCHVADLGKIARFNGGYVEISCADCQLWRGQCVGRVVVVLCLRAPPSARPKLDIRGLIKLGGRTAAGRDREHCAQSGQRRSRGPVTRRPASEWQSGPFGCGLVFLVRSFLAEAFEVGQFARSRPLKSGDPGSGHSARVSVSLSAIECVEQHLDVADRP